MSACRTEEQQATDDSAPSCEEVRDRLVDLQSTGEGAQRADLVARALGNEFITTCNNSMSRERRECILEASQAAEAFACSHSAEVNP
jgi:hypothetical protein